MKNKQLIITIAAITIAAVGLFIYRTGFKNTETVNNNGSMTAQSHRSYSLNLLSSTSNLKPDQENQVRFSIKDDTGKTVNDFAIDHTKLMHFIIVRNDLQDFQHIHPEFDKNSKEFTILVTFPNNGAYRLFADFTPAGGQKDPDGNYLAVTVSQDVNVGNLSLYQKQNPIPDTSTVKTDGQYQLTYSIPKPLKAGKPIKLVINVMKNGQPVTNMEEYLGAQAHGILLKKDMLDFAHLHAMGTETMTHMMGGQKMTMQGQISKGPDINFDYTFPSAGVYKLFTQFQHEGKVITEEYTLQVE